jgi:hypothetical protein
VRALHRLITVEIKTISPEAFTLAYLQDTTRSPADSEDLSSIPSTLNIQWAHTLLDLILAGHSSPQMQSDKR